MIEENKIKVSPEKMKVLNTLRNAEDIFVIMSVCTKMPYVVCDGETYDDEVIVYFKEEDAQREGMKLIEQKIPIQIAKVEKKQRLGFFSNLYSMGVNCIAVNQNMAEEERIQLNELVHRPNLDKLPKDKIWVENPQLHLTALYFMQEMRRQKTPELTGEMKALQEEILVNYGRGKFITVIHEENGIPLLKQNNGEAFQPIFTDILECRKFNRENKFKTVVVEAGNIPKILVKDAKGVVINPHGVNLQLPIVRKK